MKVAKSIWPTGHSLFGFQAVRHYALDAFDVLGNAHRFCFLRFGNLHIQMRPSAAA